MKTILTFIKHNKLNLIIYLLGFMVLGLAVNLIKASTLGAGSWDTVTINSYEYMRNVQGNSWITLGMIAFSVSMWIMLIVLLYRRKARYLLMVIPVFGVALFMDFFHILIFRDMIVTQLAIKIIFYVLGALLLPLGLALMVKSSFTAIVFDELMLMLVKITKAKKIFFVRLGIEMTGILLGLIIGYYSNFQFDGTFGAVNFGSIIIAVSVSPIMTVYYSWLKIETGH